MKKIIVLMATVFLLFAQSAYAADAMTVTLYDLRDSNMRVVHVAWTDSPALTLESQKEGTDAFLRGWYLYKVQTIPGSGAAQPDDDYDITITDTDDIDVMGGELVDRDETNAEEAVPKVDASYMAQPCISAWKINVTDQATAAATGEIYMFFARY